MSDFNNKVHFCNAKCIKETDMAICVIADWFVGESKPIWFPKSQVDDDSEVYELGNEGDFVCSEWIATEKGLV